MTRVLLADDAVLFRGAVAQLLRGDGYDVVGEVGDADALHDAADALVPDLAVVDVRMPPGHGLDGLDAAVAIRARHPDVAVLVLSSHVEARHAASLFAGRPRRVGYLIKERAAGVDDFLAAVRRVLHGECVLDREVVEQLLHSRRHPLALLTRRERQVLQLMAQGRSNAALADELSMSPKTVETHIRNIFTHLDLTAEPQQHRRVLAVLAYLDDRFASAPASVRG